MSDLEFDALKQRIRTFLDAYPLDRNYCALAVGGVDRWGCVTEEFIVASAEVLEDLYARHLNN
jgi:hypothetical protein